MPVDSRLPAELQVSWMSSNVVRSTWYAQKAPFVVNGCVRRFLLSPASQFASHLAERNSEILEIV